MFKQKFNCVRFLYKKHIKISSVTTQNPHQYFKLLQTLFLVSQLSTKIKGLSRSCISCVPTHGKSQNHRMRWVRMDPSGSSSPPCSNQLLALCRTAPESHHVPKRIVQTFLNSDRLSAVTTALRSLFQCTITLGYPTWSSPWLSSSCFPVTAHESKESRTCPFTAPHEHVEDHSEAGLSSVFPSPGRTNRVTSGTPHTASPQEPASSSWPP